MENKYDLHLKGGGKYSLEIEDIRTYSNIPVEGQLISLFVSEERFKDIVAGNLDKIDEDKKMEIFSHWKKEFFNKFYIVQNVEHKFLKTNRLETKAIVKAERT